MNSVSRIPSGTFDSNVTTPRPPTADGPHSPEELETRGPKEEDVLESEEGDDDIEKGLPERDITNPAPPTRDPNLVDWDGPEDPENPMNWGLAKKNYITIMLSLVTFCVTFSSSIFSQATTVTSELYHVSTEVMTLATSLTVLVSWKN